MSDALPSRGLNDATLDQYISVSFSEDLRFISIDFLS